VARIRKALYDKKAKAKQIQPSQDNTTAEVNKPVEGKTVICRLCHKEGHKFYQCKAKTRDKQELKPMNKISNTYISKMDRRPLHHIWSRRKRMESDSNQG
jgi:hypothetical protein